MNHLTLNDIRNLSVGTDVEVHFSDYNRQINLIKEVRSLTGCGLREAVDIIRDRTMTLVVTGAQGVMNVLAMVNMMNVEFAGHLNDGYGTENSTLTVKFYLHNTKPVYRV